VATGEERKVDMTYSEQTYITTDQWPKYAAAAQPDRQLSSSAGALIRGDEYYGTVRDDGFEQIMDRVIEAADEERSEQTAIADVRNLTAYRVVGQAFDSYLICESGDTLYLVDQHAAHERLNYERMKARLRAGERFAQQLLLPIAKKYGESDYNLLEKNMDMLRQLGFEMEPFGSLTFKISALPVEAGKPDAERMLDEVLYELKNAPADIVLARDAVIRAACRYSVKAGDALSDLEIESLIREITEMDAIPTCPHGRPIAVVITKNDLMKGFKRIV
jgi:DNA mismatch repair protein MutL